MDCFANEAAQKLLPIKNDVLKQFWFQNAMMYLEIDLEKNTIRVMDPKKDQVDHKKMKFIELQEENEDEDSEENNSEDETDDEEIDK